MARSRLNRCAKAAPRDLGRESYAVSTHDGSVCSDLASDRPLTDQELLSVELLLGVDLERFLRGELA